MSVGCFLHETSCTVLTIDYCRYMYMCAHVYVWYCCMLISLQSSFCSIHSKPRWEYMFCGLQHVQFAVASVIWSQYWKTLFDNWQREQAKTRKGTSGIEISWSVTCVVDGTETLGFVSTMCACMLGPSRWFRLAYGNFDAVWNYRLFDTLTRSHRTMLRVNNECVSYDWGIFMKTQWVMCLMICDNLNSVAYHASDVHLSINPHQYCSTHEYPLAIFSNSISLPTDREEAEKATSRVPLTQRKTAISKATTVSIPCRTIPQT